MPYFFSRRDTQPAVRQPRNAPARLVRAKPRPKKARKLRYPKYASNRPIRYRGGDRDWETK